jgi:phosphoribosylanthranilate isomerase
VKARAGRTRIKFCGMRSARDVALAVAAGVDAVGVILAESPRRVSFDSLREIAIAIPPFVTKIGVVANGSEDETARLRAHGFMLQFSGSESPETCQKASGGLPYVKVFHIRSGVAYEPEDFAELEAFANSLWMFDAKEDERQGGSGIPFMWPTVQPIARERPIVVAGGLTPDNVGDCVRLLRPYAVDVRSGIETDGEKDADKMLAFVQAVRQADAEA